MTAEISRELRELAHIAEAIEGAPEPSISGSGTVADVRRKIKFLKKRLYYISSRRHCEEQSDEAIRKNN